MSPFSAGEFSAMMLCGAIGAVISAYMPEIIKKLRRKK